MACRACRTCQTRLSVPDTDNVAHPDGALCIGCWASLMCSTVTDAVSLSFQ